MDLLVDAEDTPPRTPPAADVEFTAYRSTIIHSVALGKLEVLEDGVVLVRNSTGVIALCEAWAGFQSRRVALPTMSPLSDDATASSTEEDIESVDDGARASSPLPKRRRRRTFTYTASDDNTVEHASGEDGSEDEGADASPPVRRWQARYELPPSCAAEAGASGGVRAAVNVVDLGGRMLMPGLVDGHAHAPQYSIVGTGTDLPLLEWLERYTFPAETRFADTRHARRVYPRAVRRHLHNGSTTVSYFGTIHLQASKVLADAVQRLGQRALVGKVCMDRNSPRSYVEATAQSADDTRRFVDHVLSQGQKRRKTARVGGPAGGPAARATPSALVEPVVTPRFAPSCSSELMRRLGAISRAHDPPLPVQSHLAESKAECEWVDALHPEAANYADVYDRAGLLHERTFMAHCVHCCAPGAGAGAGAGAGVGTGADVDAALSGPTTLRTLARISTALGTDAAFTPRFFTVRGREWYQAGRLWHCERDFDPHEPRCGKWCTNSGRYCVPDPDGNVHAGLDGKDVVEENLRQMCLFKEARAEPGGTAAAAAARWWAYVAAISRRCRRAFSRPCSEQVLGGLVGASRAERATAAVRRCVSRAGTARFDGGINTLLESEIATMRAEGVLEPAQVVIGGRLYRGRLDCPLPVRLATCGVLASICAAMAPARRAAARACSDVYWGAAPLSPVAAARAAPGASQPTLHMLGKPATGAAVAAAGNGRGGGGGGGGDRSAASPASALAIATFVAVALLVPACRRRASSSSYRAAYTAVQSDVMPEV
eukprot:g6495.t1